MVNYINLATARAGLRAREVAMRKVLGADRGTLARHYVGEAIATTAIAGFIGLVVAEIGLPLVNAAGGLALSIGYFGANGIVLPLVALVLVVGTVAGLYPAIMLARLPAAAVLASARSPGGGRAGTYVREALVVFQFAIAIAFIIGTMVLVGQTRHVRNADLGYHREGMMLVFSLGSQSLNNAQRDNAAAPLRRDARHHRRDRGQQCPRRGHLHLGDRRPDPRRPGQGPLDPLLRDHPRLLRPDGRAPARRPPVRHRAPRRRQSEPRRQERRRHQAL